MLKYLFPAITAGLLLVFFLSIPELSKVPVSPPWRKLSLTDAEKKHIDRIDIIIMAGFLLIFSFIDFFRLGNTEGVQSFAEMNGKICVLTFDAPSTPDEIHLFTGVGFGTYTVEFSPDGADYVHAASFVQESDKVLKWVTVYPELLDRFSYMRISCIGNAWLGEAVLTDVDGNQIGLSSEVPELTDEQEQFCREYSFMNSTYFDEIYHARTAWEHLNGVYPYEISHPPLGKLIISIGISLFGMTPFGWRFSGTLFGVLMLPVMYVFLKKLFGSRRAAAAGTLVFATDFMRFVQTRIATIDTYAVFFILLMYLFMYIYISEDSLTALALCGISFGLGAASKWTCFYAGAGLAVIWAAHMLIQRISPAGFIRNSLFCTVFFIIIPCIIYYLAYIPYGIAQNIRNIFSPEYAKMVLANQQSMFSYHSQLVATHPYSSKWYQWILDIRPILYYLQYFDGNTSRISFGAFVNPMLCWGGLLTMITTLYMGTVRHDRNALFILVGYLAQLLPWVAVTRLTFEYHYFPSTVFLTAGITYVFSIMEKQHKKHYKACIWGFAVFSAVLFVLFFPVLSGIKVRTAPASAIYGWLPTWPF